jgi:hypothetical protein
MNTETSTRAADRDCPTMFIVLPAFVGGLIWLCTLLQRVGP